MHRQSLNIISSYFLGNSSVQRRECACANLQRALARRRLASRLALFLLAAIGLASAQLERFSSLVASLPAITARPTTLAFSYRDIGLESPAKTVTVNNNQSTSLTILSITTDLSDYTTTTNCPQSPATLAGNTSCTVSVFFTPSVTGERNGTLTITDDAGYNPTVSLRGTGVVPPSVSPTSLSFSPQTVGTTSAPQQVTLTNNLPTALSISAITSSTGDYLISSACPIIPNTLAAGASCTVSVTFSPKESGNRDASLRFRDNAQNNPQIVSLTGIGVPAVLQSISVTPQAPSVVVGNTLQFTATGNYNNGTTRNLTTYARWRSSLPAVAEIAAGLATTLSVGSTKITATFSGLVGSSTLTVIPFIQSRVPERICLIESETSLSVACTLPAGISVGDGVVVFITSTAAQTLEAGAMQDSEGNVYAILGTPTSGGYGTINAAYSNLTTALKTADSITLNVPGADSWGLSVYDIGPAQSSQPDVGVSFENPNVGLPGVDNPATGVPGWWTGQTPATQGSSDMCLGALGVGAGGSDDGAPAPITSYTLDGNFIPVSVSQFYSQSDPNFMEGGTLLTSYTEAPAGTSVQSHVTGPNANTAPAVLYCFSEGPGPVIQTPLFTGNYCSAAATCTINNVAAGDMLIVSGHTFNSLPATPISVTDSQTEVVTFDQINNVTGLGTWHISPVVNAGAHTIAVNDANDSSLVINVMEVSGQAAGNPVESVAQSSMASASMGAADLETSVSNDLLYGWGRASNGTDEGEGLNAVRVTPTAEYTIAPGTGQQTVTILPRPPLPAQTVGDQAMAIRPAGTSAPPIVGPNFTGNYSYCQYATSCTINDVSAGDMLVLSFFWWGQASDLPVATDSLGEVVVTDRNNDTDGTLDLALWHIASVVNAGSHTLSVTNFTADGPTTLMISEYSSQSAASPVDAVTGANGSGTTAGASVVTSEGNDWVYVACVSPAGTTAADNYAQIASDPAVQFRPASPAAGTESVTCPLIGTSSTWVIQELAIKH